MKYNVGLEIRVRRTYDSWSAYTVALWPVLLVTRHVSSVDLEIAWLLWGLALRFIWGVKPA